MKNLKFLITIILGTLAIAESLAQETAQQDMKYRRSSIYSILVSHSEQEFCDEIKEQFVAIPVPDKYNDHGLSINAVTVDSKGKYTEDITNFVERNNIASRLVGRWFNRNILTGECDMELVKERGLYNASEFDKELAKRTKRGLAMLQDAGEDLIGNTYLLVNEVRYIDKNARAQKWGLALAVLGSVAGGATGNSDYVKMGQDYGNIVATLKGFSVKIHTRLYQLVWNDEIANQFYTLYYSEKADEQKKLAFDKNRSMFQMKYIGEVESSGAKTSFLGIKEEEPLLMIRKACRRAIDENVADLQKKYEQFRIKAPVLNVEPAITVQIGLKEGIDKDSRFEVLEAREVEGKMEYKRIGVIKPVAAKIWDNRYMATEEGAYGADFKATTFVKVSGGDFYPGMLVRQIK